jgi:Cu/Ag efflux protein CusF
MIIKRVIPAVLVATVLTGSAFAAAALSMSGVVKTIDTAKHDIVLQSGETFALPSTFDVKKVKVGEKVKVTYEKSGNRMVATNVVAAK